MKAAYLAFATLLSLSPQLRAQELRSPDGDLVVKLSLTDGVLSYDARYKGKVMLQPSPLGLETSIGSFSSGLKAAGFEERKIDDAYTLPHGKVSQVHYQANELTAHFTNLESDTLDVILRVSNHNIALAYRLSSKDKGRVVILGEKTGFKLPGTATAFLTPQAPAGTGYKASKPSYEEPYTRDQPLGTASPAGLGYTFPSLFHLGSDGWLLLSETGVSSQYAGTRLNEATADGLYTIAFPEKGENAGIGDNTVAAALPALTSWKTITLGSTLKPIVETTIATDVVQPLYEPSQVYAPGRASWSWLLWQDASMNFDDQKTFIDLAATMGYEYILMDALWDTRIGRDRMPGLVDYARSKKVGVLLWYNSNGYWNDTPQSPRGYMDAAPARQREFAWLKSIGVKGMKVDFFGGDKQVTMKLYEDILTDANAYGLMLNFHGTTLPRGWERMYPNYMTSEAVLASENLVFDQKFDDKEAQVSTIMPFVRNPVGAMDFGPLVLNKRLSRDQKTGTVRRTTDAFQLATTVTYQSPLQHFGLTPNNLDEQPAYVIDFLKQVPAAWDEVRFIDGYPGQYVALARRSGERWYIGATYAGTQRKIATLQLPWLRGKTLTLIHDKTDRTAGSKPVTVSAKGTLEVTLEPGGGAVLFTP